MRLIIGAQKSVVFNLKYINLEHNIPFTAVRNSRNCFFLCDGRSVSRDDRVVLSAEISAKICEPIRESRKIKNITNWPIN